MLLRSSSTPFLHPRFLSSSSLQLRRAFSDSHIPSLHRPSSSSSAPTDAGTSGGGLHTELSFSIYNTFGEQGGGAPLASQLEPRDDGAQHEQLELLLQGQQQRTVQPDHPEVPLFLARGLGIDRSPHRLRLLHRRRRHRRRQGQGRRGGQQGDGGRGGAGREGGRAGRAVQADGGRAARQRAVPAQLRAVPARGEVRPEKGGGVLLARHARGPRRRRDHVAVRQAGVGGVPRPGEVPRLLPEVRAGCPTEQPCPRRVRQLPVGAGRRRPGGRRPRHRWSWGARTGSASE